MSVIFESFDYAKVVDVELQRRILANLHARLDQQHMSFTGYRLQYFEHFKRVGEQFQLSHQAYRVMRRISWIGNVAGTCILASLILSRAIDDRLNVQNDVDAKDLEHYLRSTFSACARAEVHQWFGLHYSFEDDIGGTA
jgi:hypothetical protein